MLFRARVYTSSGDRSRASVDSESSSSSGDKLSSAFFFSGTGGTGTGSSCSSEEDWNFPQCRGSEAGYPKSLAYPFVRITVIQAETTFTSMQLCSNVYDRLCQHVEIKLNLSL